MRTTVINPGAGISQRVGRPFRSAITGIFLAFSTAACGPNEGILKSGKETPSPSNGKAAMTSAERDVEDMRTANFTLILVLRRRDGGPIDAEDRAVIKAQTSEANRRIASDDGKAFVIGANGLIPTEKLATLQARFAVEDHSPQPVRELANTANANK